jgi:hypothetical protein
MRHAPLFSAVAFVGVAALGSGCGPPPQQGSAFIEGILQFGNPPACDVNETDDVSVKTPLLDVGFGGTAANSLNLALKVRTNLPSTGEQQGSPSYLNYGAADNNIITFTQSEVFFSTDGDRDNAPVLQDPTLNGEQPRRSGVTGVAFNEGGALLTESVILMTAITAESGALLRDELSAAVDITPLSPTTTVRITANILLEGLTSGNALVRTAPFPVGVELCIGCIILQCAAGEVAVPPVGGVCHRGQDDAFVCAPAP